MTIWSDMRMPAVEEPKGNKKEPKEKKPDKNVGLTEKKPDKNVGNLAERAETPKE
jgi:hypothetical protein